MRKKCLCSHQIIVRYDKILWHWKEAVALKEGCGIEGIKYQNPRHWRPYRNLYHTIYINLPSIAGSQNKPPPPPPPPPGPCTCPQPNKINLLQKKNKSQSKDSQFCHVWSLGLVVYRKNLNNWTVYHIVGLSSPSKVRKLFYFFLSRRRPCFCCVFAPFPEKGILDFIAHRPIIQVFTVDQNCEEWNNHYCWKAPRLTASRTLVLELL